VRVFVTGASGGIGSAVVSELIGADHHVVGLARSEASAATISGLGAAPLGGDIADLDVLKQAASDTTASSTWRSRTTSPVLGTES
jgi:uncharacterized protein YbjT (DUF2867 family)